MSAPISVGEIVRRTNVNIASLDKDSFSFQEPAPAEKEAVGYVFDKGIEHLRKVSPVIANDIARQKELAIVVAGIAKASFPSPKNYTFPSTPGNLGVAWLDPYTFKWATPGANNPCYSSYTLNTWDISITAGTAAYIMGSSTDFYKSNPNTDSHSFVLIFENGLIEYGTTPSVQQFRLVSDGKTNYGAYTVPPLIELPVEKNVTLYQYPTPLGAVPVGYDRGLRWEFMPRRSGTMTLKLLGMVFYEYNFLNTLKTAS
jgi:hypothetical protein